MFKMLQMSQTQICIWHKTGYGFRSQMQFFIPFEVKPGYGCLDTTCSNSNGNVLKMLILL